jgi:hypothetical protein
MLLCCRVFYSHFATIQQRNFGRNQGMQIVKCQEKSHWQGFSWQVAVPIYLRHQKLDVFTSKAQNEDAMRSELKIPINARNTWASELFVRNLNRDQGSCKPFKEMMVPINGCFFFDIEEFGTQVGRSMTGKPCTAGHSCLKYGNPTRVRIVRT